MLQYGPELKLSVAVGVASGIKQSGESAHQNLLESEWFYVEYEEGVSRLDKVTFAAYAGHCHRWNQDGSSVVDVHNDVPGSTLLRKLVCGHL